MKGILSGFERGRKATEFIVFMFFTQFSAAVDKFPYFLIEWNITINAGWLFPLCVQRDCFIPFVKLRTRKVD